MSIFSTPPSSSTFTVAFVFSVFGSCKIEDDPSGIDSVGGIGGARRLLIVAVVGRHRTGAHRGGWQQYPLPSYRAFPGGSTQYLLDDTSHTGTDSARREDVRVCVG